MNSPPGAPRPVRLNIRPAAAAVPCSTTQTQQEVSRTAAWWPGGRGDSAGRLVAQGKVRGVSNQLSASIPV